MRKLFWILGLFLVGVAAALPGLCGWLVARHHADAIAQLDSQWQYHRVTTTSFTRGWFSSQLVLRLTPTTGGPALTLNQRIAHGIFTPQPAWLNAAGPLLDHNDAAVGQVAWQVTPAFDVRAAVDLSGAPLPPAHLKLHLSGLGKRLAFSLEGFSQGGLTQLAAQGNLDLVAGNGQVETSVQQVSTPEIALQDLTWQLDFQRDGEVYALQNRVTANNASVTGFAGPFSAARLDLNLDRIHGPTLAAGFGSGAYPLSLVLAALLNYRPQVAIEHLAFGHASGDATVAAKLELDQPPPAGWLNRPAVLLGIARGDGSGAISRDLLALLVQWRLRQSEWQQSQREQVAVALIGNYEDQGLLVAEGNRLVNQWTLQGGELSVNGRPYPLAPLP